MLLPTKSVVADLGIRGKLQALAYTGTVEREIHRGIKRQVGTAKFLVDDGADLYAPSVGRKAGTLVADFGGETQTDRKVPAFRCAHAGANVAADVFVSKAWVVACKYIEAGFKPVVPTIGNLDGFMNCVMRRLSAVGGKPASSGGMRPLGGPMLCNSNMVECAGTVSLP